MTDPRDDWRTNDAEDLFKAVLSLETADEVARFMRDLCTYRELEEMTARWKAVRLLEQALPYREVAAETGMSTATVTRVSQWLQHGMGGYRIALDRRGQAG